MKRADSWSPDDDRILAATVIEYVTKGSTQGKGFEEAGERLTRTPVACGFRWNGVVRKDYEEELREAKVSRRKNRVESPPVKPKENPVESITKETKSDPFYMIDLALREIKAEMNSIRDEAEMFRKKLREQPRGEDLAALMEMFDRARGLGLIGDNNSKNSAM